MADSPHTSRKTAYHHGDLRTQLIAAARKLIELHGSGGFSLAEAARQAAVSTAAPYRHFRDRTALLHAVAEDAMTRLTGSFDSHLAGHEPGSAEAITAIGCAYVDFAAAEPGVFRLMFAAHEEKPDSLSEAGKECYGRLLRQVSLNLGEPEDAAQIDAVALPLWMLVHGASFLLIDGKLTETDALHGAIGRATRRLLAAPSAPPAPDTN